MVDIVKAKEQSRCPHSLSILIYTLNLVYESYILLLPVSNNCLIHFFFKPPEHVFLICLKLLCCKSILYFKASFCAAFPKQLHFTVPSLCPSPSFLDLTFRYQLQLCSSSFPVSSHKYRKKKKTSPSQALDKQPTPDCSLSEPSLQSLSKNKLCITGVHQHPV